jgi:hypothetical protein
MTPTETPHTCHAERCDTEGAPTLFMCPRHWAMVPPALRQGITSTYRPGQEIDKAPSAEYLAVATAAITAVAHKQSRTAPRTRRTIPVQLALFTESEVRHGPR